MADKGNFIFQEWFFEANCVSRWEFQAQNSIFEELPRILMMNKLHWFILIDINWPGWNFGWFMLLESRSKRRNFISTFDRIDTFQTDFFIVNPIFASCISFPPSNIFVDILRTDLIILWGLGYTEYRTVRYGIIVNNNYDSFTSYESTSRSCFKPLSKS